MKKLGIVALTLLVFLMACGSHRSHPSKKVLVLENPNQDISQSNKFCIHAKNKRFVSALETELKKANKKFEFIHNQSVEQNICDLHLSAHVSVSESSKKQKTQKRHYLIASPSAPLEIQNLESAAWWALSEDNHADLKSSGHKLGRALASTLKGESVYNDSSHSKSSQDSPRINRQDIQQTL